MILATYSTFEQMHGRKSSISELIDCLRPYSRESVLTLCAFISILLKLWDSTAPELDRYDHLISCSFDWLRGDWYKLAARISEPEFVFHRRQLLLISKLAIFHCPDEGLDVWRIPPGPFGTLLLMANDHFHYGLSREGEDEFENVKRLFAELIPVAEGAGSRPEYRIVRARLMLDQASMMKHHPEFIDVAAEFLNRTGMSVEDYEALCFALFAKCATLSLADLDRGPSAFTFVEENFYATAIQHESIRLFLKDMAAPPSMARTTIKKRDYGTNDFTEVRKHPLCSISKGYLPLDVLFAIEKFESGPYWVVNDISTEKGNRLRRFWGAVFEAYMNSLVKGSLGGTDAIFLPDPRRADDTARQICDGLILQGSSLVLLEYKANMFTAETKYSGDFSALAAEIESKLVRGTSERGKSKKKGVEQLADAVLQLFGERKRATIPGLDLSGVKRVYPLLVTLDVIGASLLLSRLLMHYFSHFMGDTQISDVHVMPLMCTDVQSFEEIAACFPSMGLASFLDHWVSKDPNLISSLAAHTVPQLQGHPNERLSKEWLRISDHV